MSQAGPEGEHKRSNGRNDLWLRGARRGFGTRLRDSKGHFISFAPQLRLLFDIGRISRQEDRFIQLGKCSSAFVTGPLPTRLQILLEEPVLVGMGFSP